MTCSPDDRGGAETILVVEADSPLRRMLRRVLAARGYAVELAHDTDEALRRAGEPGAVDLVIVTLCPETAAADRLADRLRPLQPSAAVLCLCREDPATALRRPPRAAHLPALTYPFCSDDVAGKVREVLDARARA